MSRMIRKQVYIEPEQQELLKRRSRELGVSEATLIRLGIERVGATAAARTLDHQAWEDELAFIRQRARIKQLGRRRGWTREELYEERLKRFSR